MAPSYFPGPADETPKRNFSAYQQQHRPKGRSNLLSLRSPLAGNRRPVFSFNEVPSPTPFSRYLQQQYRKSGASKRDLADGWVDEVPATNNRLGGRAVPEAPRKAGRQSGLSPRQPAVSVARRLFAPDLQQQQQGTRSSAAVASRIAYLRELVRAKHAECERLKQELSAANARHQDPLESDRLKRECIQLRQENDSLKAERAKQPSILLEASQLRARVRQLEEEQARSAAKLDAVRQRHASEAEQLLGKMRELMEERNGLVRVGAEQARIIERLKKTCSSPYSDENYRNINF